MKEQNTNAPAKTPIYKKKWAIVLAAVLAVVVLVATFGEMTPTEEAAAPAVETLAQNDPAPADPPDADISVFSDIQIIDRVNVQGDVIGQSGLVIADYDLLSDEILVAFFQEHIDGSGLNYFDIDFGNGTGYRFFGSRNHFALQRWEEGIGVLPVGGFGGAIIEGNVVIIVHQAIQYMQNNNISIADISENPMLLIEHVNYSEARDVTDIYFNDNSFVVHTDAQLSERVRGNLTPAFIAHADATRISEMLLAIPELDDLWENIIMHFGDYGTIIFNADLVYEDWSSGYRLMDNLETHRIATESISISE